MLALVVETGIATFSHFRVKRWRYWCGCSWWNVEASKQNFIIAEQEKRIGSKASLLNLKKRDAFHLPIENESIDIAAQNRLYSIF
jgi:hypothetical protein